MRQTGARGERDRRRRGERGRGGESSTDCPPKSCMPSRANTTMKRKSRNSKLMIDFIELRRDTTRLRKDAQYLMKKKKTRGVCSACCTFYKYNPERREVKQLTHLVTLKILNNLRARNTLMPNDVPGWMMDHRTSNMLPHIT